MPRIIFFPAAPKAAHNDATISFLFVCRVKRAVAAIVGDERYRRHGALTALGLGGIWPRELSAPRHLRNLHCTFVAKQRFSLQGRYFSSLILILRPEANDQHGQVYADCAAGWYEPCGRDQRDKRRLTTMNRPHASCLCRR